MDQDTKDRYYVRKRPRPNDVFHLVRQLPSGEFQAVCPECLADREINGFWMAKAALLWATLEELERVW